MPPSGRPATKRPLSFPAHVKATVILGGPLVAAQVAHMLITVTDTVMLGWLGTEELAAGALAFQFIFIFYIFGLGIGAAMMPLIAGALGQEDPQAVRRSTRMGFWALFALSIAFLIPLGLVEPILVTVLGQSPVLADLANQYMIWAKWSIIPMFAIVGQRSFFSSVEWAKTVLILTLLAAALNGLLNYGLIFGNFGLPRMEMAGAGLATLIANSAVALAGFLIMAKAKTFQEYTLFVRAWRPDWPALREITVLAFPIGLTIFAEAGLFSAASIMIGWIGTLPLAAHAIVLQLASLTFMVPLGLSQAGSVRVGNANGRGSPMDVGRAGWSVFIIGMSFATLAAILFFLVPKPLISLYLDFSNPDAAAVLATAIPLLWVAAAFQLADAAQAVASGSLRGLKDTRVPMQIAVFSYWAIGVSVAYMLAFPLGWGAEGVWFGLAFGLLAAAILLNWRFAVRETLRLVKQESLVTHRSRNR